MRIQRGKVQLVHCDDHCDDDNTADPVQTPGCPVLLTSIYLLIFKKRKNLLPEKKFLGSSSRITAISCHSPLLTLLTTYSLPIFFFYCRPLLFLLFLLLPNQQRINLNAKPTPSLLLFSPCVVFLLLASLSLFSNRRLGVVFLKYKNCS